MYGRFVVPLVFIIEYMDKMLRDCSSIDGPSRRIVCEGLLANPHATAVDLAIQQNDTMSTTHERLSLKSQSDSCYSSDFVLAKRRWHMESQDHDRHGADLALRDSLRRALEPFQESSLVEVEGRMRQLEMIFRSEAARAIAAPIEKLLSVAPQGTFGQKQELASQLNSLLDSFGLRVRCPESGRAARLVADFRDDPVGGGRFRFESEGPKGRRSRLGSCQTLYRLEIVPNSAHAAATSRGSARGL